MNGLLTYGPCAPIGGVLRACSLPLPMWSQWTLRVPFSAQPNGGSCLRDARWPCPLFHRVATRPKREGKAFLVDPGGRRGWRRHVAGPVEPAADAQLHMEPGRSPHSRAPTRWAPGRCASSRRAIRATAGSELIAADADPGGLRGGNDLRCDVFIEAWPIGRDAGERSLLQIGEVDNGVPRCFPARENLPHGTVVKLWPAWLAKRFKRRGPRG